MTFKSIPLGKKKVSHQAMRVESAKELAERVLLTKRDLYRGASALDDGSYYLPNVPLWYRLYRLVRRPGIDATASALREASASWLRSAASSSLAYALVRKGEEVRVFFGGSREVESSFHNRFPEAQLDACAAIPLSASYAFNGALVGGALDLSLIADSCELKDCYVACISDPFPYAELAQTLETDREYIGMIKPYISSREFSGSENQPIDVDVPRMREACAILEREVQYLEDHDGFRRAVVRFGAATLDEFNSLCALLDACIQRHGGRPTSTIEGIHRYTISGTPAPLAVPLLVNGSIQGHALALQAIDDALAPTCMPGLTGHPGYYVHAFGNGESIGDIFPIAPPLAGLPLGKIEGTSCQIAVPVNQLATHAFVFGATGSGKSTTIRTLLLQLHQNGIPFLVVESAKKEYSALLQHIPDLRIYGGGIDCHPLRLDPFHPEEGTMIATQTSDLSQAIYLMTGGESPLPQAIEMCVRKAYERKGWNANEAAFDDPARTWPNFDDLLATIPEVTAQYAPEVRMNLSAALTLRIETIARRLAGGEGMRMQQLLSCPTLIELADFGAEVSVFITMLLLKKMQAYLTKLSPSDELRGVCVLEESHNLFRKADSGIQALTNSMLDKLLAEIRSSGYGIVLSEQRPSLISDSVLANCGLRIVHAVSSGTDLALLRDCIGLTEEQATRIPYFAPGEALVSIRTQPQPQHVRMHVSPTGSPYTAGCIICDERFRCHKQEVRKVLLAADPALLKLRAGQLAASPYDPRSVLDKANLLMADIHAEDAPLAEKCCILGAVLNKCGVSFVASRYIVRNYERQLKGE